MAYATILLLHSWLRWFALAAGVGATASALTGNANPRGARWSLLFTILLDLQFVLGLLLYFVVSPNMTAIRENFGEAMGVRQLRFWAVEHVTGMVLALVLAHLGRVLARKAVTPNSRRTRQLVCFGLALLIILASIPWPGLPYGRPLLRP